MTVVFEAMKLSFEMRRNDILTNIRPVEELLEEYPFLGTSDQVSLATINVFINNIMQLLAEFSRILHNPQLIQNYNWTEKWLKRIVIVCCNNLHGNQLKQAKDLLLLCDNLPGIITFINYDNIFIVIRLC